MFPAAPHHPTSLTFSPAEEYSLSCARFLEFPHLIIPLSLPEIPAILFLCLNPTSLSNFAQIRPSLKSLPKCLLLPPQDSYIGKFTRQSIIYHLIPKGITLCLHKNTKINVKQSKNSLTKILISYNQGFHVKSLIASGIIFISLIQK